MSRPRSEQAHQAALDATVDVLAESGVDGVTLEEVAARSGVAKSTLYRHFGSKEALVAKAARCCVVEHPTPNTGSLADDLRFLFERFGHAEDEQRVNDLLPMLIDASRRDPAMADLVAAVLAQRTRPLRTILQLAQLRGEIDADLDLDTALAMISGPFAYRRLVEQRAVTTEFAEAVLVGAIAALRATAGQPTVV
ncbi:TetR/AcrR family transcriptional regulator [soil metagenome]